MKPRQQEQEKENPTRRHFFGRVLGGIGALFALIVGAPGAATVVDPLLRGATATWRRAMALADLKEGIAAPFPYEVEAGWERRKETVYLVRRGEDVIALSARCTHLGCRVRAGDGEFRCPCHGGVFGPDGEPRAGPVTRALARLETRIVDGHVEVRA